MAYKKNKKKPKIYRGRKKYSLNDRIEYHNKRMKSFYSKYEDNNGNLKVPISTVASASEKDKHFLYSSGFVQGAKRGKTLNFEDCPKANQAGQSAGVKAREKAFKVKF